MFVSSLQDANGNRIHNDARKLMGNSDRTITMDDGVYNKLCDYFLLDRSHPLRLYYPIEIRPNQSYAKDNNIGCGNDGVWDWFTHETVLGPIRRQPIAEIFLSAVPLIYGFAKYYLEKDCIWHQTSRDNARMILASGELNRGGSGRDHMLFSINTS